MNIKGSDVGKHRVKGLAQDGPKGDNSVLLLLQLFLLSVGVAIHRGSGGRLLVSWLTGVIHTFPQWAHLTPFPITSGKSCPPLLGQVEPPACCADRIVVHLWVPSGTGKAYQTGKVNSAIRKHALLFALAWKAILCHASPFLLLQVARFKSDFLGQCLLRE